MGKAWVQRDIVSKGTLDRESKPNTSSSLDPYLLGLQQRESQLPLPTWVFQIPSQVLARRFTGSVCDAETENPARRPRPTTKRSHPTQREPPEPITSPT
jgi:hypothetical protein